MPKEMISEVVESHKYVFKYLLQLGQKFPWLSTQGCFKTFQNWHNKN